MSLLTIEVNAMAGGNIKNIIAEMCALATKSCVSVASKLNDVRVIAQPDSDGAALFRAWEEELQSKRPYKIVVGRPAVEISPAAEPPPPGCEDWWHLKQYGYAPGKYTMKCPHCQVTVWNVDKRARCCKPCATAFYDAAQSAVNR